MLHARWRRKPQRRHATASQNKILNICWLQASDISFSAISRAIYADAAWLNTPWWPASAFGHSWRACIQLALMMIAHARAYIVYASLLDTPVRRHTDYIRSIILATRTQPFPFTMHRRLIYAAWSGFTSPLRMLVTFRAACFIISAMITGHIEDGIKMRITPSPALSLRITCSKIYALSS